MQNQKVIEQLGYTAKEAKVYLASLSLGEAHISDIAARVKMPRSSVQLIADKLHEDGLMNFYVMRRYKYWVAEKPARLLENLKRREEIIEGALPELSAIRRASRKRVLRDKNYRKSIALFSVCAEASRQPVLIANSDAEIEFVNSAWQVQFGYTLDEVRGKNPRIVKSSNTPKSVYTEMWRALDADKMFQSTKIINKCKDGSFLKLRTTIFPVHHGNRTFFIQILNVISSGEDLDSLHKNFIQTAQD